MPKQVQEATPDLLDTTFAANAVRLSARDWIIAALIVLLVVVVTPLVWKRVEPLDPSEDFRVPFALSDDYWTYERFIRHAVDAEQIVLIGDSVIWGEYVEPQRALPHYLDQLHDDVRFANGGLNGTHPLALHGLVRYYAGDVRNQRVMLHCNLLWMSSPERDLQSDKELTFNHPKLTPQFVPRIPCYRASANERMGIALDRYIPYRTLVSHWRVAGFDSLDIPSWTLEHPHANPWDQIRLAPAQPKDEPHSDPVAWTERGIQPQDIPWIDLDTSLQWQAFQATADLLRQRGNRLLVIVGPFNEHMLTGASRQRYRAVHRQVTAWLDEQQIPHFAPPPLPSEEYADASHPLRSGYARLAEQTSRHGGFQRWLDAD